MPFKFEYNSNLDNILVKKISFSAYLTDLVCDVGKFFLVNDFIQTTVITDFNSDESTEGQFRF